MKKGFSWFAWWYGKTYGITMASNELAVPLSLPVMLLFTSHQPGNLRMQCAKNDDHHEYLSNRSCLYLYLYLCCVDIKLAAFQGLTMNLTIISLEEQHVLESKSQAKTRHSDTMLGEITVNTKTTERLSML